MNFINNVQKCQELFFVAKEQAGDFYDAGIKKLVPRLTKCIAIHGDC
jgi:hypothetical protein